MKLLICIPAKFSSLPILKLKKIFSSKRKLFIPRNTNTFFPLDSQWDKPNFFPTDLDINCSTKMMEMEFINVDECVVTY